MNKGERMAVLKDQFCTANAEKQKVQKQGVNLYVKNLDDQVRNVFVFLYEWNGERERDCVVVV